MGVCSPSRVLKLVLIFCFFSLTLEATDGQVLELPDLIIIREAEPDIPLPNQFPDFAENWNPTLPKYRRQYKIPIEGFLEAPKSPPDNLPLGTTVNIVVSPSELLENPAQAEFLKPGIWDVSLASDIRQGADFTVNRISERLGRIGGKGFIPFLEANPRPWSGEISWERDGLFLHSIKIGAKKGSIIVPYFVLSSHWVRGINQPDDYFLELYHFGSSTYRLSILGGMDLSFRIKEGKWSIITKIEGGISHKNSDTEGSLRVVSAVGLDFFNYGLRNEIGVDIACDYSKTVRVMPFLGFKWLLYEDTSLYANAEISMRYPDNLGKVFFRERVKSFEAQIPIQSKYRFGIARIGEKLFSYLFEIAYAEGIFCEMENGIIMSRDDRRVQGLTSIAYNLGSRLIKLSGRFGLSLLAFTDVWEGRVELVDEKLSYYIFSGSQDAILAEFFDGFRGKEVIIGLGLDWGIGENWEAGATAYAGIPWDKPSLTLVFTWRSTGAADE